MKVLKEVGDKIMIEATIDSIDILDVDEMVELEFNGVFSWISKEDAVELGVVSNTVTVKCPSCKGTGDPVGLSDCPVCSVCNGTGKIEAELV